MTTWHEVARDSRKAANEMVETRFRSCLSRAYYAAYSKVTHDLAAAPNVTFPAGREGPSHPGESGTGGIRRLIETSKGINILDALAGPPIPSRGTPGEG